MILQAFYLTKISISACVACLSSRTECALCYSLCSLCSCPQGVLDEAWAGGWNIIAEINCWGTTAWSQKKQTLKLFNTYSWVETRYRIALWNTTAYFTYEGYVSSVTAMLIFLTDYTCAPFSHIKHFNSRQMKHFIVKDFIWCVDFMAIYRNFCAQQTSSTVFACVSM